MSSPKVKAVNDLIDLAVKNFAERYNLGHIAGQLPDMVKARIDYADPMIDMVLIRAHAILHEYEEAK